MASKWQRQAASNHRAISMALISQRHDHKASQQQQPSVKLLHGAHLLIEKKNNNPADIEKSSARIIWVTFKLIHFSVWMKYFAFLKLNTISHTPNSMVSIMSLEHNNRN